MGETKIIKQLKFMAEAEHNTNFDTSCICEGAHGMIGY